VRNRQVVESQAALTTACPQVLQNVTKASSLACAHTHRLVIYSLLFAGACPECVARRPTALLSAESYLNSSRLAILQLTSSRPKAWESSLAVAVALRARQ
jgi:hypothetical protein